MKSSTSILIIPLTLLLLLTSGCNEWTQAKEWNEQSNKNPEVIVAGDPNSGPQKELDEEYNADPDDDASYSEEDIQALQKKIDNKETLTQDDIALYEQAEADGYDFGKENCTDSPQDQQEPVAMEMDQAQWKNAFGDQVPVLPEGMITNSQNMESDGKIIASRAQIEFVRRETIDQYVQNILNQQSDQNWSAITTADVPQLNQTFQEHLYEATGGMMEPADLDNSAVQVHYFQDDSGNMCQVTVQQVDGTDTCTVVLTWVNTHL